ncbi:GspH/FimT family pseudopilin [Cycloclasticus sp. P1]|uniref:GspH/FimT family pseudopilin n=1 Tax=Cycloclasticus sp. (strain P1) TaxID=385025 RepID=UPI000286A912|nr:GspH/FimT family pseudopilin [Cycloclasticus sp. P1]AFT66112.1 Fimbrial protein pilin [Cycloclasticus sp. P1]KXJ50905.1 MAG: hypothetical protein AXW15_12210 [Neptuniibacter sp. Phe_28]
MDRNTQKGFTLIELLIVVVILGILVAIAAPSFGKLIDDRRLKGAAENLFVDMMFAKTEAIKKNQIVTISATGTGAIWCYGLNETIACDCTTANSCQIDGVEKVVSNLDYPNVDVVASSTLDGSSISFTPLRGFANGLHLKFSSTSSKQLGAAVSPLGRVRLCSDVTSWGYESCL